MDSYEYMTKSDRRKRPKAWWLWEDRESDHGLDQQQRLREVLHELPLAKQEVIE